MGMTQASEGELLLDLRCLRNRQDGSVQGLISELLPGLPCLRNQLFGFGGEKAVNYCLIYGTSETNRVFERAPLPR